MAEIMVKYRYPATVVDLIVVRNRQILLIRRKNKPYKGFWALPGGFLDYGVETLEKAAIRELREETGLKIRKENISLFGCWSNPKRDPRIHSITHVYEVNDYTGILQSGDDAAETEFWDIEDLPKLAFDHGKIVRKYKLYRGIIPNW